MLEEIEIIVLYQAGLKEQPVADNTDDTKARVGQTGIEAGRDVIQTNNNNGIINTGQMGNINTGSGTQLNIENQSAGRDINNIGQQIIVPKEPERVCPSPSPPPDKFGGRDRELI